MYAAVVHLNLQLLLFWHLSSLYFLLLCTPITMRAALLFIVLLFPSLSICAANVGASASPALVSAEAKQSVNDLYASILTKA